MAFTIKTLTAFVAVDEDGEEGLMSFIKDGTHHPLVCADETRIHLMYPMAEYISAVSGLPYRIIQFSERRDVTEEMTEQYKP